MKPVMQRRFGPTGDCFSACLASILELPLDAVPCFFVGDGEPDPIADSPVNWWSRVRSYLGNRGLGIMSLSYDGQWDWAEIGLEGYQLVAVKTDRGFDHSQVWHRGRVVHDPHPASHMHSIVEVTSMDVLYALWPDRYLRSLLCHSS